MGRSQSVDCWRAGIPTGLLYFSPNLANSAGHLHAYSIVYPDSPGEDYPQAAT